MTVTSVAPSGNTLPEGGVAVTVGAASAISVAVGSGKFTVAPEVLVASATTSDRAASVGAVVSWTVTVKDAFARLPDVSEAEKFTV